MSSISSEEIISVLKSEIENYELETKGQEVGTVIWIGDGIATVYGLDHAMYGEIVVFDTGVKGMVQDIKRNEIGIILLGKDTGLKEGSKVSRTKKKAGIPVSDAYIGRVIDALGAPIDGKGSIDADDYRPIENDAPGIVDRKSVNQPLETGILTIDSMFPIGRGQRELIIGDRQTGKTSIATDAIITSAAWLNCPTIIMSTAPYMVCKNKAASTGSAKPIRDVRMFPSVKLCGLLIIPPVYPQFYSVKSALSPKTYCFRTKSRNQHTT